MIAGTGLEQKAIEQSRKDFNTTTPKELNHPTTA